jgi:uncharacterized protein YdaU (DUF1376 family)
VADAPWTKWFHEDFLQGCMLANLTAEEIGVYTVVLNLMAARGGPIEADSRWINGYAGCATTRKLTAIIDRLVDKRKLERRGRLLGNAKMIRTVEDRDTKSQQARRAALSRWHAHAEPDLFGGDNGGDKQGDKHRDKSEITPGIKEQKPRKTAKSADADACSPVRARDSEVQIDNLTHPNHETVAKPDQAPPPGGSGQEEKPGRLGDADLMQLYDAVAKASGHNPSMPGQIDRAMGFVQRWQKDGIDFDQVVVPTIKAVIAETRDPTRTLGRFDARIRHEHARLAATPAGRKYQPPASPVMEPEGEDPMFRPARVQLLEDLGPHGYANLCNPVRFEAVEDVMGGKDRRPVKVVQVGRGSAAQQLFDGDRRGALLRAMRPLGFTEVW